MLLSMKNMVSHFALSHSVSFLAHLFIISRSDSLWCSMDKIKTTEEKAWGAKMYLFCCGFKHLLLNKPCIYFFKKNLRRPLLKNPGGQARA